MRNGQNLHSRMFSEYHGQWYLAISFFNNLYNKLQKISVIMSGLIQCSAKKDNSVDEEIVREGCNEDNCHNNIENNSEDDIEDERDDRDDSEDDRDGSEDSGDDSEVDGKYSGQVNCSNEIHGNGKLEYRDGSFYKGRFLNGHRYGFGTSFDQDVGTYEGNWCNGFKQGQGQLVFNNDDKYTGSFHRDHMQGHGEMVYKEGHTYIGEWVNSKWHGRGVKSFGGGKFLKGVWEEGCPVGSFIFAPNVENKAPRVQLHFERARCIDPYRRKRTLIEMIDLTGPVAISDWVSCTTQQVIKEQK